MIEMAGRKSDAPARLWMRKTTQAAGGNARTAASGSERAGEPPSIRWARAAFARQMTQIELLQHTGFRRVGSPKNGFRFVGAPRREVPRLRSLRIPPAWTDVAVSRSPRARRLARAFTLH
jgi:DNA topoisomerase IB-like protein